MNQNNAHILLTVMLILLLFGCATPSGYKLGLEALDEKNYDVALEELQRADRERPDDIRIQVALTQTRRLKAQQHMDAAWHYLTLEKFSHAESELEQAILLDSTTPTASQLVEDIQRYRQAAQYYQEAENCLAASHQEQARTFLVEALKLNPGMERSADLLQKIQSGTVSNSDSTQTSRVSFEFQEMSLGDAFRALAAVAESNLLIDESVNQDRLITVNIKDANPVEIMRTLATANGLMMVAIDPSTTVLCTDSEECRQRYARDDVKLFVLRYADADRLRQILEPVTGDAVVLADKRTNSVVVRARPDRMPLVAELINAMDIRESEVLVEVEILEVTRTRMEDLGLDLGDNPVIKTDIAGPLQTAGTSGRLSLSHLNSLNSGSLFLTMPSIYMNLLKKDSHTRILAEPRLRIVNRTAARLHIGEQVPIKTTSSLFRDTSEELSSFNYRDVGIVMNLTPRILSETELALDLKLEVSSIIEANTDGHPTIGTREVETTLRLQDGQVEVIAGLLKDEERQGRTKIPLLGEVPVLGHLFSSKNDESVQTDIIISLTPHIVDRRIMGVHDQALWSGKSMGGQKAGTTSGFGKSTTGSSDGVLATSLDEMETDTITTNDSNENSLDSEFDSNFDSTTVTVWIEPETTLAVPGDVCHCAVRIKDAVDVGSVPFYIDFNPNLIEILSVKEGDFLGGDGAATAFMSSVNKQRGRVIIGLSRVGAVGGISGEGDLVILEFTCMKAGHTPLAFSREAVLGPTADLIPSRFIDGQVSIQSK